MKLPLEIGTLIHLHHLDITNASLKRETSLGVKTFKNPQTSDFVVGNHTDSSLKEFIEFKVSSRKT